MEARRGYRSRPEFLRLTLDKMYSSVESVAVWGAAGSERLLFRKRRVSARNGAAGLSLFGNCPHAIRWKAALYGRFAVPLLGLRSPPRGPRLWPSRPQISILWN
jgi:hypothetical protein